jgi:hypothetical protein
MTASVPALGESARPLAVVRSRLRLAIALAVLANTLLMFWRFGSLTGSAGNIRILDITSAICVAILGWRALTGRLVLPHTAFTGFLLLFPASVVLSTGVSLITRDFPMGEPLRIALAAGRLVQTLLMALVLRLTLVPALVRPLFQIFVMAAVIFPAYSVVAYLQGTSDYVRLTSFVPIEVGADGVVNELGALFATTGLLGLGLALHTGRAGSWRALNLAVGALGVAGAVLTFSRSALFSLACGALVLAALTKGPRRLFFVLPAVGAVGWIVTSESGFATSMVERVVSTLEVGTAANRSMMIRFEGWASAWRVFLDNPVLGVGYACYATFNRDGWITPESYPFEILADLGLIGFAVWSGFLLGIGLTVGRLWSVRHAHRVAHESLTLVAPSMAALLVSNLTGNNFFDPGLLLLFLGCAAVVDLTWRQVVLERRIRGVSRLPPSRASHTS